VRDVEKRSLLVARPSGCFEIEPSVVFLFKVEVEEAIDGHQLATKITTVTPRGVTALFPISIHGHRDSNHICLLRGGEVLFLL